MVHAVDVSSDVTQPHVVALVGEILDLEGVKFRKLFKSRDLVTSSNRYQI